MRTRSGWLLTMGLMLMGACSEGGAGGDGADTGGDAEAPSAVGAAGRAQSTLTIAEMRSHLNVLEAAGGDEMVPMVPEHRARVEALLTQLGPRGSASPAWNPLADSVRSDLTRMQGMTAAELEALMDPHAERVRRLIEVAEGGAP